MQPQSLDGLSDQLVFVNLDLTCWSGKKTLTPEDLGLDRTQLPPETLVSLGEKQLIDPEALRTFTSIRSAARRRCLAVGTRFLGGYAVPVAKAPALLAELDALGQRYQDARAAFLAGYDDQLAAWTQQQPQEWQKLIRDALVPVEYVGGRLSFAVQAMRFAAPDPAVVTHDGLNQALSSLGDQVFHEVGQLAREALERSFQGKDTVTRRALSPLASIRQAGRAGLSRPPLSGGGRGNRPAGRPSVGPRADRPRCVGGADPVLQPGGPAGRAADLGGERFGLASPAGVPGAARPTRRHTGVQRGPGGSGQETHVHPGARAGFGIHGGRGRSSVH